MPPPSGYPAPPGNDHILHVEEGLERLMGDRALYLQMLRRFRKTYLDCAARLRAALDAGELEQLQRLVHTLKGAAGMIGAQQVYRHALALEEACGVGGVGGVGGVDGAGTACASPDGACGAALAQLAPALHSVLGMIESILDGMDPTPAPEPLTPAAPPASAQLLVQQLARLLEDGDGAAIDLLEQSASVLAAGMGVAVFQEVAAAAHQFDFEAALAALAAPR